MKPTIMDRMTALMNKKDINQAELSKRTGITQSSLSDYIKGKYSPKQDKIDLIARALGVSPAYLMGWDDAPIMEEKKPHTIAAHATEDLNEEEIEEVYRFIDFIKSKKNGILKDNKESEEQESEAEKAENKREMMRLIASKNKPVKTKKKR